MKQFKRNFMQKDYKLEKIKKREAEQKELEQLVQQYDTVDSSEINTFDDIPLTENTRKGLSEAGYTVPTKIQKESIIVALRGLDVLGASKTGSGKTLAFLLPVLEILYRKQWTKFDGIGAIIMTPTRELALQIYQTLVKVGKHHNFSAGLIIGGKDLSFEKERMHIINIIICTPGRLLQHMDINPLFDCTNLQILVLDEADRCLDMGFEKEMNAIIENFPKERLTLLFSATQTKKVKDLARLSLVNPTYISVHEHEKYKTPEGLTQSYIICEQHEKISVLWSFIKAHPKHKIMIFFSTCNQVKFIFDIMCHLRPYNTLFALTGKLKQNKRMEVYQSFSRKQHAVLFATDLASRGLDFPEVHWVIHADCPEDVETYIHRSGRTARIFKGGESLLLLNPSEKAFVNKLEENRIPINEIKVNPQQMVSPQAKMEAFLAKDPELKVSAQRAFVAYTKSVYLMKDKSVFNIKEIDTHKFARSLGLIISPRIRFIEKAEKNKTQSHEGNAQSEANPLRSEEPSDYKFFSDSDDDSDKGNDVLTMKRRNHDIVGFDKFESEEASVSEQLKKNKNKALTKVKQAKRMLKKKIKPNKKIVFSEEGEALIDQAKEKVTEAGKMYDISGEGLDIEEARKVLREEDKWDRKLFREKLIARRQARKEKLKAKNKKTDEGTEEKAHLDVSEDEDSEPDLSWLPDPDKVYTEKNSDNEENKNEPRGQKRKLPSDEENEGNEDHDDEPIDKENDLSIKEKEELALKFLESKM
ncbi:probable ATP-dependent RNA helicase DDX10 [Cimex lectularius]|uniref:ATP-dependent RNA helicase n=1 Tax=Cimex lectularius TaxID=79782 RepID=A0A8I6RKS6_CIMLE|nr:probable ATP-dependent RNA helicase DDX10 [Cimex lectularius]